MDKAQILDVIRRMAATNGGKAPGSQKFESETGLGKADWYPKYWLRWGDGIRNMGSNCKETWGPPLFVDANGNVTQPVLAPHLKISDLKGRSLMVHVGGDNHADHPAPLGGGGARIVCGVSQ